MATFTPSIVVDPDTGEEIVSYDQGVFDSGEGRNAAIAHHMQTHQAQYVTDADGRIHHEWSDLDPERYQKYEEDYVDPEEYAQQYQQLPVTEEDQQYLHDIVGGTDAYEDLLVWASRALDQHDINAYDQIMGSGDIGEMEAAIRWLYDQFTNAASDDDTDEADEFTNTVLEAVPNYQEIIDWGANNLSAEMIAEYNDAMDNGSDELRTAYINKLIDLYEAN
jgi:hypothetical protein